MDNGLSTDFQSYLEKYFSRQGAFRKLFLSFFMSVKLLEHSLSILVRIHPTVLWVCKQTHPGMIPSPRHQETTFFFLQFLCKEHIISFLQDHLLYFLSNMSFLSPYSLSYIVLKPFSMCKLFLKCYDVEARVVEDLLQELKDVSSNS